MENSEFRQTLFSAYEVKLNWYNEDELKTLLEEYRTLHSVLQNLTTLLIKKGQIQADPYKLDKKISDIIVPDDSQFLESERAVKLGSRLSDYERSLDFICNLFQFSIANLTVERIKNLVALNNYIDWKSVTPTAAKMNTRALGECIGQLKKGEEQLSYEVAHDSVVRAAKAVAHANQILKNVMDFQKEVFKVEIRKNIFDHPSYSEEKSMNSVADATAQIKKLFPQVMGKRPYYSELVDELVQEEYGPNKEQKQKEVLKKFEIVVQKEEKKKAEIDTKELLMEAVRTLSGMAPQLDIVIAKINENHALLESEHQSFMDKLIAAFRKAFNLKEPPAEYVVTLIDASSQSKRNEVIKLNEFLTDLSKRSRVYNSLSVKKAAGYVKLEAQSEEAIEEYLIKQLSECNKLMMLLTGLDDYFKAAPKAENKAKVKGMKMELTAMKNITVKTNQRKAEYTSYVEEAAQLKKLGITNA